MPRDFPGAAYFPVARPGTRPAGHSRTTGRTAPRHARAAGELVQWQAPLDQDQDGLPAVSGQRGLEDLLVRLVCRLARHQQPR